MERVTVGSDSKNGVRHQRALSPRLSMMMMMVTLYKKLRFCHFLATIAKFNNV